MIRLLVVAFILTFSLQSFSFSKNSESSLSVMAYNLENLFDTTHDEDKEDYTYLPLAFKKKSLEVQKYCAELTNEYYQKSCLELDWSDSILFKKLNNLAKVIKAYNRGCGADIIIFEEIENINILKRLVKTNLKGLGYKSISLVEGADTRGIDVAIISKYPLVKQKLHTIDLAPYSERETRGILETSFRVNKRMVTVFANHWPSQGNVDHTRLIASKTLKIAAEKSKSDLVIAAGDFNTLADDMPNGLQENIYPHFIDVEKLGRKFSNVQAKGTHWYRGEWASLDKIFVLKKSLNKSRIRIDYSSFKILYKDFMLKDLNWVDTQTNEETLYKGIPHRFNSKTGEGYSDHLPIAVEFKL